jgi:Holliday junction resolvase-like predicted endonuclease
VIPSPKSMPHGMQHEEVASMFLVQDGHKILCRNYKIYDAPFKGEIDIISQKNNIVFLNEVKGRTFFANDCISTKQQERIWHTYQYFLEENVEYNNISVQMQLLLVVNGKVNILEII